MKAIRRKDMEAEKPVDTWQMTYCSVIIILVAIFMMVISYSRIEGKKMAGFINRIGEKKFRGNPGPQGTGAANPVEVQIESALESLKRTVSGRLPDGQAEVTRTRSGIKVTFADGVFFDGDALKIRNEALPLLDDLASLMKETPFVVGIAGYGEGDSSAGGASGSSWEFTASRANFILRHLSGKGGVPMRRLAAAGFGHYNPAGSGEGRERNRRIELFFELP